MVVLPPEPGERTIRFAPDGDDMLIALALLIEVAPLFCKISSGVVKFNCEIVKFELTVTPLPIVMEDVVPEVASDAKLLTPVARLSVLVPVPFTPMVRF
jgi:hypothetical protein